MSLAEIHCLSGSIEISGLGDEDADHLPMHRARLEIEPGLVLDARRAVWLAETRTLVVADLHLGYVWAHRHGGQMLPLGVREDTAERLLALIADYDAREIVLLGDIVHRAVPVAELRAELGTLFRDVGARVALTAVAGNHDRQLAALLRTSGVVATLVREHRCGPHVLLHGDQAGGSAEAGGRVFIGHEHPAISLSDRVAHSMKCPCFLVGPRVVVLPAFSGFAAGGEVRGGRFLGPVAQAATFETAVAILAGKLLAVPLPR
jgi:DNA ligase-associated metallophosphoesterase